MAAQTRSVWYVEDDTDIAQFAADHLSEQGFTVQVFPDGLRWCSSFLVRLLLCGGMQRVNSSLNW